MGLKEEREERKSNYFMEWKTFLELGRGLGMREKLQQRSAKKGRRGGVAVMLIGVKQPQQSRISPGT